MKYANESLNRPALSLFYKPSRRSWTEILIFSAKFNRRPHPSFITSGWTERAVFCKRMHQLPRLLYYATRDPSKRCHSVEVSHHRSHCQNQWCLESNSCNFLRKWVKLVWLALASQLERVVKDSKRHVQIHLWKMRYTRIILCDLSTLDALSSKVVSATFHSRNSSRWHPALLSLIKDKILIPQPTDSFLILNQGLRLLLSECTQ